jgi:hypothetical protein
MLICTVNEHAPIARRSFMTAAAPDLRPLTLGEILDRAVRLYRHNFANFIGIIALVQVPLSIIQLLLTVYNANQAVSTPAQFTSTRQYLESLTNSGYLDQLGIQILLALISFVLVQGVATAALTRAVADNYLGRKTDMLEAYQRVGGAWARLIGVIILMVFVYIALMIWLIIPCIGWISGPGILVYVAGVIGPLIAPVVVLENLGAGAIRRAWELVRRRFWWVLGFMVILMIFNQLIVAGPSTLVNLFLTYALNNQSAENYYIVRTLAQSLVSLATSLFYLPLQLAAVTLMYFDLRVRTEGFDLAILAAAAPIGDASAIASQGRSTVFTPLVTGKELGNFVLLSILGTAGGCLIYILFMALFMSLYSF